MFFNTRFCLYIYILYIYVISFFLCFSFDIQGQKGEEWVSPRSDYLQPCIKHMLTDRPTCRCLPNTIVKITHSNSPTNISGIGKVRKSEYWRQIRFRA